MSTEQPNQDVQIDHVYSVLPGRVYDAWLSSSGVREWLFPPTDAFVSTTVDPKVDGKFNFTVMREGQEIEHSGTYSVLDRPRRLVFTWELPKFSKHKARVFINITAIGTGSKLTLVHEDIPEEYFDRTKKGWINILERLDDYLEKE